MTGKLGAREAAPNRTSSLRSSSWGGRTKLSGRPSEISSEVEEEVTAEDWEWFKLDTLKHLLLFEKNRHDPGNEQKSLAGG